MARWIRLVLLAIAAAVCSPADSTGINASTYAYDAQAVARVDTDAGGVGRATSSQVIAALDGSISRIDEVGGPSTTPSSSVVATEAVPGYRYQPRGCSRGRRQSGRRPQSLVHMPD